MGSLTKAGLARMAGDEVGALRWRLADEAPDTIDPVAIAGTILCTCGKGGRVVVTGARVRGEWMSNCDHSIEVTHWMPLPAPPAR